MLKNLVRVAYNRLRGDVADIEPSRGNLDKQFQERRQFLKDFGRVTAGFALLSLPFVNFMQAPHRQLSPQEIDRLIEQLEQDNARDKKQYSDPSNQKTLKFIDSHEKKYGTVREPKLDINLPVFVFRQFSYQPFPLSTLKKDKRHYDVLFELYETACLASLDWEGLSKIGNPEKQVHDLERLIDNESLRGKRFIVDGDGSELTIDSAGDFIDFAKKVATKDMQITNGSILDHINGYTILDELIQARPEMDVTVKSSEQLESYFSCILKRMLKGYPDAFPSLIVHPSKWELTLSMNQFRKPSDRKHPTNIAAFHRPLTDSIETYSKKLHKHILELSHEFGHPFARLDMRKWDNTVEYMRNLEYLIPKRDEMIQLLKQIKTERDPYRKRSLEKQFYGKEAYVKELNERTRILGQEAGQDRYVSRLSYDLGGLFFDIRSALDEAAAWLFQDILLNEFAFDNPEIGSALLQLRDYESSFQLGREHYGAFRFAKELKKKYSGDSVSALREIAFLTDERKMEEYKKMIQGYNNERKMGLDVEDFDLTIRRMDKICDIKVKCHPIARENESLSIEDSPLIKTKERRLLKSQKRLAELYRQYMDMLYRN